jgi:hypothetical protein
LGAARERHRIGSVVISCSQVIANLAAIESEDRHAVPRHIIYVCRWAARRTSPGDDSRESAFALTRFPSSICERISVA